MTAGVGATYPITGAGETGAGSTYPTIGDAAIVADTTSPVCVATEQQRCAE